MARVFHSLPRHVLLRICALDLVRAMLDAVAHPVAACQDEPTRQRVLDICGRIELHRERAFKLTVGGERLDLSGDDKASARYVRAIANMRQAITAGWGQSVSATSFVPAVMALVAQAEEQIPGTPEYAAHREEWGTLHVLVGELYEAFDPDFEDTEGINHGANVAERMVRG